MGIKAFITGIRGTALSADERSFIDHENPWGLILFARNIEDPKQLHQLVDAFRETVGRGDAPVLIDQEGGRVQRLRPPHWSSYAPGRLLGDLWRSDRAAGERAVYLQSRLIAHDLAESGINVDCLPVLDVPAEGCHDVIGDRAYSTDAEEVAQIGQIACQGLLDGAVLPVIKHIPGHGRATCDSHKELPVVDGDASLLEASDFVPFRALNKMPMAMTAHVRYHAFDADNPATTSQRVISQVIRGDIGFDGLLMSDDVSMEALEGDLPARAEASLLAGCDMVLHCNGNMEEMEAVAAVCPVLEGRPRERADAALEMLSPPVEIDVDALREEYRQLTGPLA